MCHFLHFISNIVCSTASDPHCYYHATSRSKLIFGHRSARATLPIGQQKHREHRQRGKKQILSNVPHPRKSARIKIDAKPSFVTKAKSTSASPLSGFINGIGKKKRPLPVQITTKSTSIVRIGITMSIVAICGDAAGLISRFTCGITKSTEATKQPITA